MCRKNIVYVADIDADIDDVIAAEYLARCGFLKCVVLDGKSRHSGREKRLAAMGVEFRETIPEDTKVIFCGGAFTKIAQFISSHKLDLLVANGGFAGANIVAEKDQLEKFKGKETCRTFNLNMDIKAAAFVFDSPNIAKTILVAKNVCHSDRNIKGVIHNDDFLKNYNFKETKKLHDLLMVKEGVAYLNSIEPLCEYKKVHPICEVEKIENMSRWGCAPNETSSIVISIRLKEV